MTEVEHKED